MRKTAKLFTWVTSVVLLPMSQLTQAGFNASVTFRPLPADAAPTADAIDPAVPVPLMSDLLMVSLGLLLAVVAVRVLRKSKAGDKIVGLALLCGGLALSGYGAKNAEAVLTPLPIEDPDCGSTAVIEYDASNFDQRPIENTCEETYVVVETMLDEPGRCQVLAEGSCEIGTELATNEQCVPDYYEDNCEQ